MKDFGELYRKIEARGIEECGGTGTVYEHIATGARIFTIQNDDSNKVFMIGFRTTPTDSTGVAHIMEHSVLCGSEKFPLKDPFVELAKGSLNTFLNAMTYPDKTVYPVASCNEQDFMNLMDVYLDAVLHPNIYRERKIFEQEGWHYELKDQNDPVIYNGVVYNEMKGAFSSPEAVLERYTMHALFPDTTYGFESGGDPEVIPALSYEDYLHFHETYYHPSNSYIYLYGDLDMEEKLRWIDEHYLAAYGKKEVHSEVARQAAFSEVQHEEISYPVGAGEEEAKHTYLSENYVIGGALSQEQSLAWQILEFLLIDAPGAPLKEALIKAGIGEDIFGGYVSGILQPYFSLTAKNADKEDLPRFRETIRKTLEKLVRDGLNRGSLAGAINHLEFKYREADFGRTPAGLAYGLTAMESWLYGESPFMFLCYNDAFAFLKEQQETGYFEELIRSSLLDNAFAAEVVVAPERGLAERREAALAEKLAAYKAGLSDAEIKALIRQSEALAAYQEEETTPEQLAALPVLEIADIAKEGETILVSEEDGLIYSGFETHGIAYIRVLFDTAGFSEEELQYAAFLKYALGELDTKRHDFRSLTNEILLNTGGIDFDLNAYPYLGEQEETEHAAAAYCGRFTAELRVLSDKLPKGLSLVGEILGETLYADEERIYEKLLETKSRMQMKLDGASHSAAVCRAGSYGSAEQRFDDLTGGIAFYDFLSAAAKLCKLPSHRSRFVRALRQTAGKLFERARMSLALSGSEADRCALLRERSGLLALLDAAGAAAENDGAEPISMSKHAVCAQGRMNEGFKTTSQVNYVARSGSFAAAGLPYTGALQVLRVLLNYDYLWMNLRVKGGAYGCMSGFMKSGRGYLVSYRDPHIGETDAVYEALPDYLAALSLSEVDLRKYIIGAIASIDQPVTPAVRAARAVSMALSGVTEEALQKQRGEILGCTQEDLRALAPYVRAVLKEDYRCVIGNAAKITEETNLFNATRELYS